MHQTAGIEQLRLLNGHFIGCLEESGADDSDSSSHYGDLVETDFDLVELVWVDDQESHSLLLSLLEH